MNRMSREELRMLVRIGLTVRKKYERRQLELQTASAIEAVTDDIVIRIMGREESETVLLRPDLVGPPHSPSHGRWGVDEPHPHPDVPFRRDIPASAIED